jgi:hypothetical protein
MQVLHSTHTQQRSPRAAVSLYDMNGMLFQQEQGAAAGVSILCDMQGVPLQQGATASVYDLQGVPLQQQQQQQYETLSVLPPQLQQGASVGLYNMQGMPLQQQQDATYGMSNLQGMPPHLQQGAPVGMYTMQGMPLQQQDTTHGVPNLQGMPPHLQQGAPVGMYTMQGIPLQQQQSPTALVHDIMLQGMPPGQQQGAPVSVYNMQGLAMQQQQQQQQSPTARVHDIMVQGMPPHLQQGAPVGVYNMQGMPGWLPQPQPQWQDPTMNVTGYPTWNQLQTMKQLQHGTQQPQPPLVQPPQQQQRLALLQPMPASDAALIAAQAALTHASAALEVPVRKLVLSSAPQLQPCPEDASLVQLMSSEAALSLASGFCPGLRRLMQLTEETTPLQDLELGTMNNDMSKGWARGLLSNIPSSQLQSATGVAVAVSEVKLGWRSDPKLRDQAQQLATDIASTD